DDRIRRLAKDCAIAAGGNDHPLGRESLNLHGPKIHGANSAAVAISVEDARQKFPAFVFVYFPFRFKAADLFVESVQKLLSGGSPGERRAIVESPAEAAEIE